MPEINTSLAPANYKFKGHTVSLYPHFTVGQVLTANDAKFANRQLASVIGNMLGASINRKVEALQKAEAEKPEAERLTNEDGTPYVFSPSDLSADEVQALATSIYTDYEIGVSNYRTDGSGGATRDPVKSIADNIAWERIKGLLSRKNIKVGSVKAEKRAELIAQMHAKDPSILVQAKATYEGSNADASTDGLDLSILDTPEPEAASDTQPATEASDTQVASDAETQPEGGDSAPDQVTEETSEPEPATEETAAPASGAFS